MLATGLCLGGCRTEPPSSQIGITTLDIYKIPDGVPPEAEVTFFGKPGHTYPVRREPVTREGSLYVYDDTDHRIVYVEKISPQHPAVLNLDFDPTHDYRGFFAPSR
jgi:hypothetical protein